MAFNSQMHERNIYKNRPDFAQIALKYPEFRKYALSDAKGKVRVDFTDPDALRILTKILLKKDFDLTVEIPKGFLIPTVPQRLNYILWIEDLISVLKNKNKVLRGIDIGCGPCAIFSILGAKKNGWTFTATDTSQEALQWAFTNIKSNNLSSLIKVVKVDSNSALSELLTTNEEYDFCLCNPPFFEDLEDMRKKTPKVKESITSLVKKEEVFAEGGEVSFVKRIIEESLIYKDRVKLYTSMFGKKKSFVEILKVLQGIKDITVTKSQFCQGNTIRWSIAWTFNKSVDFRLIEKPKSKKTNKAKPPLLHHIPRDIKCGDYNVQELSKIIYNTLKDLEILMKVVRIHEHYTECQITTDKNTWSNQRRKRREIKRNLGNAEVANLLLNENLACQPITGKKRKLDVEDPENVKKSRSDFDQTEQCDKKAEPSSHSVNISSDNQDTKKLESVPCHIPNKESDSANLKMAVSEKSSECCDVSKKRKLVEEDDSESYKKTRLDFDQSEQSELNSEHSNQDYKNSDSNQENSVSSLIPKEENPELMETINDSILTICSEKKESKLIQNRMTNLIKAEEITDANFEPKSLLFCTLKIRRAKDFVVVEMNCPDEANRESMYQIHQYLKNKLN